MHIDRYNGVVTLPNNHTLDPSLSEQGFRASGGFANARSHGMAPWLQYRFSGGHIEGNELLVSLDFYDQMLVSMNISANLYPPGAKDWSNYSLDVEAAIKDFHDCLLEQSLGPPTNTDHRPFDHLTSARPTLACIHNWTFSWGTVASAHDFRGGGTFITVLYGNRHEQASKAYRREQPTST